MLNYRRRECTPQRRGFTLQRTGAALATLIVVIAPGRAAADSGATEPGATQAPALAETANLDGYYIALGPRGAAVYSEDAWDAAFGAEASLYRYRDDRALSLLGLSAGMIQLSELDGGHVFAEAGAGTDLGPGPIAAGLSLGLTARLNPLRHARWGAHATLWAFAGAIPYVRAGILQDTGMFVDFGIRLALPAARW